MLSIIKKCVDYIARLLAFLLVKLYLAIPVIYVVGFVIVGLMYGFSIETAAPAFVLGLVAAFLISLSLAAHAYLIKPITSRNKLKKQRAGYATDDAHAAPVSGEPNIRVIRDEPRVPDTVEDKPKVQEGGEILPKLYRTYSDPSIIIAEYPDRYEYYKRTPMGVIFLETVYK